MRNPRSTATRGIIVLVGSALLLVLGYRIIASIGSTASRSFGGIFTILCLIAFICGLVMTVVGAIGWSKQADRHQQPPASPPGPPAGWLPDPTDATLLRYWDGVQWTGQTAKRDT